MTKILIATALVFVASQCFARGKGGYGTTRKSSYTPKSYTPRPAPVRVKGYMKKSGTYVEPSYKTSPNKTKKDNYGTKGNYNPYTGKEGTNPEVAPWGASQ